METPEKSTNLQFKFADKFDLKTILIIILLLVSMVFGSMWFFGGSDASKEKIKQLETEFKKLEKDKVAADSEIADWKSKYEDADKKDKQLELEVSRLKSAAKAAEDKAKKSKHDLDKLQSGISENRREIEYLKKNPPILSDDELLEALIKKMN
jgi:chromosome segregation ATPase